MAIYLITAGGTFPGSGLVDTVDGLALDFSLVARQGYVTTIGNGTDATIVVTHNLDTRDVIVKVVRAVSPFDEVEVDTEISTVNTATLYFAVAPPTNEYRVLVQPNA